MQPCNPPLGPATSSRGDSESEVHGYPRTCAWPCPRQELSGAGAHRPVSQHSHVMTAISAATRVSALALGGLEGRVSAVVQEGRKLVLKILARGSGQRLYMLLKFPGPIALLTQGPILAHSGIFFRDPTQPSRVCVPESSLVAYLEGWREGTSLFIHPASLQEKVCCLLPCLSPGALPGREGKP